MLLGPPLRVPGPTTPSTPQAARITGPQPTVNAIIPLMYQKVVATFNRLYPNMSVLELCERGKVRLSQLKVGREGACVNYGLFGRCSGCQYRHEVCTVATSRQAAIVKVMESALSGKHFPWQSTPAAPRIPRVDFDIVAHSRPDVASLETPLRRPPGKPPPFGTVRPDSVPDPGDQGSSRQRRQTYDKGRGKSSLVGSQVGASDVSWVGSQVGQEPGPQPAP